MYSGALKEFELDNYFTCLSHIDILLCPLQISDTCGVSIDNTISTALCDNTLCKHMSRHLFHSINIQESHWNILFLLNKYFRLPIMFCSYTRVCDLQLQNVFTVRKIFLMFLFHSWRSLAQFYRTEIWNRPIVMIFGIHVGNSKLDWTSSHALVFNISLFFCC